MDDPEDAVQTLYDDRGLYRVVIFALPSGVFSYREEKRFANEYARGWMRLPARASFYDTPETARREVVENVPWLRERKPTMPGEAG